jgi:hypothetical protein
MSLGLAPSFLGFLHCRNGLVDAVPGIIDRPEFAWAVASMNSCSGVILSIRPIATVQCLM